MSKFTDLTEAELLQVDGGSIASILNLVQRLIIGVTNYVMGVLRSFLGISAPTTPTE